MSMPSPRDGLSLDQAPPLIVPASFFVLAPAAVVAAGILLLAIGAPALRSGGVPASLALTHLGTLGVLGSVMIGALYQMAPVVAGAPVPAIRLAHGVQAAWVVGLGALVTGFLLGGPAWFDAAALGLGAALAGFLGPVAVGMLRAKASTWTSRGMRLALVGLFVAGGLGLAFATLRGGHPAVTHAPGFDVARWRLGHFGLGLTVWVGGLLAAVSWQVLPMFYLAPEVPPSRQRATFAATASSLLAVPLVLGLGGPRGALIAALAPAAVAAWLVHPALALPRVRARQRKRRDETANAWMAALACGPAVAALAGAAVGLDDPRWGVACVWLAVWGWAGLAVHGMLCRIVPFLVWFHRLSPLVGKAPVPAVRQLMPQDRIRAALGAHAASVGLGLLAIGTGWDPLARATGLAVVAAGLLLGRNVVDVLRFRPG